MPDGIELIDRPNNAAAVQMVDTRRIGQKEHRVASRLELHALKTARQKSIVIIPAKDRLVRIAANHDHISRQIAARIAQTIMHPRTKGRTAGQGTPSLNERDRWIMIDRLGLQ